MSLDYVTLVYLVSPVDFQANFSDFINKAEYFARVAFITEPFDSKT